MKSKQIINDMTKGSVILSQRFTESIGPQITIDIDSKDGAIEGFITVWCGTDVGEDSQANAELIMQSFNVANKTKLTPKMLLLKLKKSNILLEKAQKKIFDAYGITEIGEDILIFLDKNKL